MLLRCTPNDIIRYDIIRYDIIRFPQNTESCQSR